jgi:hypothetical protein
MMPRIIGYDAMNARHRIDNMDFTISFDSMAIPHARESALRTLLVDELLPLMDQVFNQFADGDTVWQIDTLDIDIGDVPVQNFNAEMASRLRSALESALKDKLGAPAVRMAPDGASAAAAPAAGLRVASRRRIDAEQLLAYLAHGNLPWQVDVSGEEQHALLLQRLLENGADHFLGALRQAPERGNMLLRLVQQFPEPQLQEILRRLAPGSADRLQRLLGELRQVLGMGGLDSASQSQAMRQAWLTLLDAACGAPDWSAVASVIVRQAAAAMQSPDGASGLATLASLATTTARLRANSGQYGEIAAALNYLDTRSSAVAASDAAAATPNPAPAAASRTDDSNGAGSPEQQRVRDRLVQAILSGDGEEIYLYWEHMRRKYPGLLRAAVQRYCAYGDVTERMASGFPESLLRDISRLLQPQAAALMEALWTDAGLFRLAHDGSGHGEWGYWKRTQWIASVKILLQSETGAVPAAAFERSAFIKAMLPTLAGSHHAAQQRMAAAWVAAVDADHHAGRDMAGLVSLSQDVQAESGQALFEGELAVMTGSALPAGPAPGDRQDAVSASFQDEASAVAATVAAVGNLPLLLEKIRKRQLKISRELFSSAQLAELAAAAVRLAAAGDSRPEADMISSQTVFLQAIHARAATAGDSHRYFSQVLEALLDGRPVDVEQIAHDSRVADGAGFLQEDEQASPQRLEQAQAQEYEQEQERQQRAAQEHAFVPADEADTNMATLTQAPDLQRLRERLAQALLRGDAAAIYAQWDILLLRHADLLRAALSRYGMHDDVLARIAAGFPDSLLLDMTTLLHPEAGQAMRVLWKRPELHGMADGIGPQMDRNAWLRLSWKNGLRHLLQAGQTGNAGRPFEVGAYIDAALPQQPGSDSALRQQLKLAWQQSLAPISMSGDVPAVGDVIADAIQLALPGGASVDVPSTLRQHGLHMIESVPEHIAAILQRHGDVREILGAVRPDVDDTAAVLPVRTSKAQHRTQLQLFFQQLREAGRRRWESQIAPAQLERMVFAFISLDTRASAGHRRDLISAIASRARSAPNRHDYFSAVLEALLEDRVADLDTLTAQQQAVSASVIENENVKPSLLTSPDEISMPAQIAVQEDEPGGGSYVSENIAAVLLHYDGSRQQRGQTSSEFERACAAFRSDGLSAGDHQQLQLFFQQLRHADWRPLASNITLAQLERLSAALTTLAWRRGAGNRRDFMRKIEAGAKSAGDRYAYFAEVLKALLGDGAVDLEAISQKLAAGSPAAAAAPPGVLAVSNVAAGIPDASTQAMDGDQARLAYLLGPDFAAAQALPSGFVDWLTAALQAASVVPAALRAALAGLLRNEPAANRLLELLPPSCWPQLLNLAPHPQAQQAQRCADDVIDTLLPLYAGIAVERLARLKWQCILRYLFVQGHSFHAANFARELVDYLGSHADGAVTPALAQLLRRRTGLAVPAAQAANAATPLPAAANAKNHQAGGNKTGGDSALAAVGEIYLINAGMVLAAPYLPRLWSMLELTEHGAFKSPQAAERAVHLLQFMVNEKTASPEYQLSLNKLLCGVGGGLPIVREIRITDQEVEVIEQLIKAMILHWKVIGNTSVKGLRESFLLRPGWLHLKDDAWHLRVQEGVFDMLLDQLPWSFSIIKYPWMERAVHVSWRK